MKVRIGSVELTGGPGIVFNGTGVVRDGKLIDINYDSSMEPVHRVITIELPDGAIPFGIVPASKENGNKSDVLQWYKPAE